MTREWDENYAADEIPWDTGRPSTELVRLAEIGALPTGRALDVGCGTGTNCRYLARRGYDVVGIDISPLAVERAKAETALSPGSTDYRSLDFLEDESLTGPFDLVFDRGCFHVFDDAADRGRFAERVAAVLAPEGMWLSLVGSTEGPPRDHGPPRRSASEVVNAVEPALEIVELRAFDFDLDLPSGARGWVLSARRRAVPAQPSTVHGAS